MDSFIYYTNVCLDFFGLGLCHQFPERSFDFCGVLWAVCARCSGIYVGLVFAVIALLLAYHYRSKKNTASQSDTESGLQRHGFMAWTYWIFLAAGLGFMGWDGVTSYANLRESSNFLRWVTGIGMGASLAPLLYYLLINNLAKHSIDAPVLGGSKKMALRAWVAVAISMLAAFVFVYPLGPILGPIGAVLAALCIWITFALLIMVLLGLLKPFYRSIGSWKNLVIPGTLAMIISLVLIILIAFFQIAL